MITQQLDFGKLTIYDHYIVGEMNEGVSINIEMVFTITNVAKEYFKGEPWGYISNRIHSYDLNPMVHVQAPEVEKNMLAFAAVTHRQVTAITTEIENEMHEPSYEFASFTDLDKATEWIKSILLKNEISSE